MTIPSECKMPYLSVSDSPLMPRLIGELLIGGDTRLDRKARLYRRNFIRLVDKALREYHETREVILAEVAEANRSVEEMEKHGQNIYVIAFTNHIETCINAVSRLFKLLERIKSKKNSPTFPRELRRLVETKSDAVANIRNAIEHMDELIQNNEIVPGTPIMLALNENVDGVAVSEYEMKFNELAMVLENMHEIALYILTDKKMEAKS